MTARRLRRRSGWLGGVAILMLIVGCGGDASVSVSTGGGNGGGQGPRVGGRVFLPNGQLALSTSPVQRFASALVERADALVATNVQPAGINVLVQLFRVEESSSVGGGIQVSEELFQNSTNEEGQYDVFLPAGGSADTCRFMVQVGNAVDGTMTRAFVYSTSAPIDVSFQSEAAVRLILERVVGGGASLCDFDAGDIANIYRAVLDTPTVVTGNTVAALNLNATNAARQSPQVQAAINAALGGPTLPPRPTDTVGPPPTSTNTSPPAPTSTHTQAPPPTNTVPPGATATNTPTVTNTVPAEDTPTNPPGATETPRPTRTNTATVGPTNTVPPATATPSATVGVPTGTATSTRTATATVGAPTNTATRTATSTVAAPTPTNTPMTAPPIGAQSCPLGAGSIIRLFTAFGITTDLAATGEITVTCGSPNAAGVTDCSCGVVSFAPVNVPGIGFACIKPATAPCASGAVACSGGRPLSIDVVGDHSRNNTCSSNADCASKCATKCGGADMVLLSGCEGFCSQGTQQACTNDEQCLPNNGACNGQNNVPLGNVCECTCVNMSVGSAGPAGSMNCQLAFNLQVEASTANPPNCDGQGDRVLINVGDTCAPLTTQNVMAILNNASGTAGTTIPPTGPFNENGTPIACSALSSGDLGALRLAGATIFYGSTIGDLMTGLFINCQ